MAINPIESFRTRYNISRKALAARAGVSYQAISAAEGGYPRSIPPRVLRALEQLGADPVEISREYVNWRQNVLVEA